MTEKEKMVDQESARRWRAERRRILREMHPDRGGDPDAYLAAVAAIGTRGGGGRVAETTASSPLVCATMPQVLRRHWRRTLMSARVRIPRRWPGARRYARL